MTYMLLARCSGLIGNIHACVYKYSQLLSSSFINAAQATSTVKSSNIVAYGTACPSGDDDWIHLKGLRFYGHHGVLPEVRA